MKKVEMESMVRLLDQGKQLINQLKERLRGNGIIQSEQDDCHVLATQLAYSIDHALHELARIPTTKLNSTTGRRTDRFTDKRRRPSRSSAQVKVSGKVSEGVVDDGFQWRKYGQKKILNAKHPRAYYRCKNRYTHLCPAKKYVQKRDDDDSTRLLDVVYLGSHTCDEAETPPKKPIFCAKKEEEDEEWKPVPMVDEDEVELFFNYDTTKTESVAFETQLPEVEEEEDIIGWYSMPSPESGLIPQSFYFPN